MNHSHTFQFLFVIFFVGLLSLELTLSSPSVEGYYQSKKMSLHSEDHHSQDSHVGSYHASSPKSHHDKCDLDESYGHHERPGSSPRPESKEPTADYIITLKKDTTKEQLEQYKQNLIKQGAIIKHEYNINFFKGFAVAIRPSLLQCFAENPLVDAIEPDQQVHI